MASIILFSLHIFEEKKQRANTKNKAKRYRAITLEEAIENTGV